MESWHTFFFLLNMYLYYQTEEYKAFYEKNNVSSTVDK